jgi:hypothetical protein
MAIILYLGRSVKDYEKISEEKIKQNIIEGRIRCDICTNPIKRHSKYKRSIKETGEEIEITVTYCENCNAWHALLPDFLLPYKHYSGNEIESVIIDSAAQSTKEIETAASESTVRRWIAQIGERVKMAVGVLKYMFKQAGRAISEIIIEAGHIYSELEQVLELMPKPIKYTNKLGLANIWLGTRNRKDLI